MSDIDTARHELKTHGLILDDNGNVGLILDDGRHVYVGVVDGDDVYFPRMIGTAKTWPISSIVSAADWHGDQCVLIIIGDITSNIKTRLVYYSDVPTARPRPAWPHGLVIDDTGTVFYSHVEHYLGSLGVMMARLGRVEILPPGESIVFDDPVQRVRAVPVRKRLYMHEIVVCAWDHEINGVYIVDTAGHVRRYHASDIWLKCKIL